MDGKLFDQHLGGWHCLQFSIWVSNSSICSVQSKKLYFLYILREASFSTVVVFAPGPVYKEHPKFENHLTVYKRVYHTMTILCNGHWVNKIIDHILRQSKIFSLSALWVTVTRHLSLHNVHTNGTYDYTHWLPDGPPKQFCPDSRPTLWDCAPWPRRQCSWMSLKHLRNSLLSACLPSTLS